MNDITGRLILRRINTCKYNEYIEYAKECTANRVYPLSIATGTQDGEIYTGSKGCVQFWHYCGFAYISGDVITSLLPDRKYGDTVHGIDQKGENMEEKKGKKNLVNMEKLIDLLCLAASYGILILLPHDIGALFYLIFGGSAFLFCIGFFRLGLTFEEPSDAKGELFAGLSYTVLGVLINTAGLYFVYRDHGSARSIMIAVLLMIEALVMYSMAGSGFQTPEYQKLSSIVFQAAAIFLFLFGIAFVIWKHFTQSSVMTATLLVIESICLWTMKYGSNPFNASNYEIQTVPGLRIPIRQLQQIFANVETQLGYPWIGRVKTVRQDCIIYGPSEDGYVVYGYYLFGRFHVAGSINPLFPDPEDAQGHIVTEVPDSRGYLLNKMELLEAYVEMFARYAENGDLRWSYRQ